jgi:DNA polymerase-3 subunit chi
MEIAFYQLISTSLDKTLAKLLEKVYESSQKAVVLLDSKERLDQINSHLWTYSTAAFLPHGSSQDLADYSERQPIWLTTTFENPNHAQVIVITSGEMLSFDEGSFQRCLDIFDGNDETALTQAQQRYALYKQKNYQCVFWRQSLQGQWEKTA